jgi:hypothetical protein
MDSRGSHYPWRRASSRARLFKRHPFTLPSPRTRRQSFGLLRPCWLLPRPAQDRSGSAESPVCFGDAMRALTKRVEELGEPRDCCHQARVAPRQRRISRSAPTRRSGLWLGDRPVPTTPTLARRKRAPASAAAGPPATDQAPESHRVRPGRHCDRERDHRHLARIGAPREAGDNPALASARISNVLALADATLSVSGPADDDGNGDQLRNRSLAFLVDTIEFIRRMARENRLWGAERIRGELLKLPCPRRCDSCKVASRIA